MVEIIEKLNNTSGERTLFYVFSFLIALGIIVYGIVAIVSLFMKENHPDYKGEDFVNWDNDYDSDKDS